jgi:enoyl-CoA hydratase
MEGIRLESPRLGVALLTIDRAEHFNTLSVETLEALDNAVCAIARDSTTRVVVVAGAGGESFAAGANIREFADLSPREAIAFSARGQRLFDRLERMPKAVLAAIDGYCLGGGLDLALACDVRIASPRSAFAHPGARLGILTGFGGTQRLARLIGLPGALELFASARRIDATEALSLGLVDAIEDDPIAIALSAGEAIARNAEASALKAAAIRAWRRGSRP